MNVNGERTNSDQSRGKPSICIIAHNAYGAMRGGKNGHIGGAEHQTTMMGRWLAAKGYKISFLTWDEGQPDLEQINGVSMIKLCASAAGMRVVRFVHPRMTSLFSAMRLANADIYYHNSAEAETGLAAFWCRRNGRKFIYSVASDVACTASLKGLPGAHERMLYRYGLRHASRIIVQTRHQQQLLRDSFGLNSVVLPMPCQVVPSDTSLCQDPETPARVAWIGRIDKMKRLEWLLDIAEHLPGIQFDVVAANMNVALQYPHLADYARRLHARAQLIANVVWHGSLPRERLAHIYRRAFCLCCTSSYEGFPNTFLEAWSYGRPVVSSFDPDRLIQTRRLGTYATGLDEFVTAIRRLTMSIDEWREQSRNCRDYFLSSHALDVAMPRFEDEFIAAAQSPKAGS
jgi:glycosyltransferase involved in cell wall biosynthesis